MRPQRIFFSQAHGVMQELVLTGRGMCDVFLRRCYCRWRYIVYRCGNPATGLSENDELEESRDPWLLRECVGDFLFDNRRYA